MKKILFYFVAIATFTATNKAQGNDANAKKILDGVSAKIKTFKAVQANFTITSLTSKGKSNGSKSGNLIFKGQKYVLKQGNNEVICDGSKTYNYDGKSTITITSLQENNSTLSPQNLLSNFYDKDFSYKLVASTGNTHEIELVPNDKRKNFSKVNVFIDKAKNMITTAKITDKSKNIIQFALTNVNTSAAVNDNIFVFNKAKYPKNVEILD